MNVTRAILTLALALEPGAGLPDDGYRPPSRSPDLNGDRWVDSSDLMLLSGSWGPCAASCSADLNGDGWVGGSDQLVLLGAWGSGPYVRMAFELDDGSWATINAADVAGVGVNGEGFWTLMFGGGRWTTSGPSSEQSSGWTFVEVTKEGGDVVERLRGVGWRGFVTRAGWWWGEVDGQGVVRRPRDEGAE